MCRNIKKLRREKPPITEEEVRASAYCLISKISGYKKPSQANRHNFDEAVKAVTAETIHLLQNLKLEGETICVATSKS